MLPKKTKITHEINPPDIGNDFLNYGAERIEELLRNTDVKTKYLPKGITLEDIDQAVFDYVNSEKMGVVINNNKVPLFYLENDRWGEFSKTWKFMDGDKNVPTPYITIRRIDKQVGTRLGTRYRVPQGRKFMYLNVPILDEGEQIYLLYKMPQPVNVDLIYEVVLFTKYRVDVNQYDEQVLHNFASRQDYVFVHGNPMPLHFEGFAESNTIENIDGDRYLISKYAIKTMAFIINEKEFEIVKTMRNPRFGYVIE